jgi:hypothetical protein
MLSGNSRNRKDIDSTKRIVRSKQSNEKNALQQAVSLAEKGNFTQLQALMTEEGNKELAWHSATEAGKQKSPLLQFFSAVLNALASRDQKKINEALKLLENVLNEITLNGMKLNQDCAELPFMLAAKLSSQRYSKIVTLLTKKIAESISTWEWIKPQVRFSNSVRDDKHEKQNSIQHGQRLKRPKVSKEIDVKKTLDQLARLDRNVLKESDTSNFNSLVKSIVLWDAECICKYTYHSLNMKIEDHFYGLESWLTLSLLHARFNREAFINVLSNMINLRDELYNQKQYNAALIIDSIFGSVNLTKMIENHVIEKSRHSSYRKKWYKKNFADFQEKLKSDGLDIGDHRGTLKHLQENTTDNKLTIPLVILNKFLEQEKDSLKTNEVNLTNDDEAIEADKSAYKMIMSKTNSRIESAEYFIKSVKSKLEGVASGLNNDEASLALWNMPRIGADDIDAQIDTHYIKSTEDKIIGSIREWKKNQDYIKSFTQSGDTISRNVSSSLNSNSPKESDSSSESTETNPKLAPQPVNSQSDEPIIAELTSSSPSATYLTKTAETKIQSHERRSADFTEKLKFFQSLENPTLEKKPQANQPSGLTY